MELSDQRVIDFVAKSPLRSFAGMLDALSYLDGQWIPEDIEYELFDRGLGDNLERTSSIRVPVLGGIEANALFAFAEHAAQSHLIRRRTRPSRDPDQDPDELIAFYEVTPAGHKMVNILGAVVAAMKKSD
jgi:hypothetical protein